MRARAVVPVLLLAAACSGGGSSFTQPRASAFHPGSCHDLAAPVLQLGKDLHGLGAKAPDSRQSTAIKDAQTKVRALMPQAPADLQPTVQKLVTTVGILRIRTDTDSYDESLTKDAMTAYRQLVDTCTS